MPETRRLICFGLFEVDLQAGELRKGGLKLKLSGQPFQVLAILLERPGEVIAREELQERLWPDTFVDVDHNLNTAINKIREALGDSAESPRFVETLPRRGYRFTAPVEGQETLGALAGGQRPNVPSGESVASGTRREPHIHRLLPHHLILLASAALLAGGAFLSFVYLMRSRGHSQSNTLVITPFTTYPGLEGAPSFSPDGNQIAFIWWPIDALGLDLYVKQIGQERAVRLTHSPAIYLAAAWSPDGRFIAFARRGMNDSDTGVYILPVLGGSERKLGDGPNGLDYALYLVSWSPDGKWLAYSKEDAPSARADNSPEHSHIHLLNVETAEQRVLPDPSPDCAQSLEPAFSPDGRYLASVCKLSEGVNKIYVQPPEGGRAREVALINAPGSWPGGSLEGLAWAADNQSLFYSSEGRLWRVPSSRGKPEKLLFAQDAQMPAVARTGNRLAYAQINFPTSIWQLELTGRTKPSGPAKKIITSSRGEENPHASPDGEHIVFESRRSGNPEIWVCDRDGSNPVQITSFGGPATGTPRWSPDSRRIAFDSRASGNPEVYIVNADGGQLRRLSTGSLNASSPFWSADGHWIYFSTQRFDGVWKVPAEGGTAVRLTKKGSYSPQESADGTRVFYVAGGDEIWSVPTEGGDERHETVMTTTASWALVERGIYFLDGNGGRLTFFDFATRQVQEVAKLDSGFFQGNVSVSRDGRTIFYSETKEGFADIMLVEGFR
jgi:Tol biopolymer transport system component/DNA-binding winged helix-turn-helix (wHTH) protein